MKKTFTKEEAQAWVDSRAWAKGLSLKADATIDAVEFAEQYSANPELWDALFEWIKSTDLTTVAAGKHVIVPGRLWVNILEYTPKSAADTKIESHRNFIDLQYTFQGDELMGLAGNVVPTGPYDEVKDKTNYTTDEPISYVAAPNDTFFLYFPKDMHQPSVRAREDAPASRKVVGKIEYAR